MRPLPHVPDWPRLTSGKKIQGLCPHPPLRFPRQPTARRPAPTVLRRTPRHSTEKPIGTFDRRYSAPAMALSQVRRIDGRRRTIHRRTTPTPFSTAPGHGCMKSLAHTPHGRAFQCLSPTCVSLTPRHLLPVPAWAHFGHRLVFAPGAPVATPAALTTPVNFCTPGSLHSICISPASSAPAASF